MRFVPFVATDERMFRCTKAIRDISLVKLQACGVTWEPELKIICQEELLLLCLQEGVGDLLAAVCGGDQNNQGASGDDQAH
jgi:hypothetical protein